MKPYLLALDVGTSGLKALLLHMETGAHAAVQAAYPVNVPNPGWAEQDARLWWRGVCDAVPALLKKAGASAEDIAAIGVDGVSWTPVCLDEREQVLFPAPLWYDTRAQAQCERLSQTPLAEACRAGSGNPLQPYYTLPKLLWMREHAPREYRRIRRVLTSNGYIVHRLTGAWTHDHCQAYGWGFYRMERDAWDEQLAEALGVDLAWLPPLCPCTQVAGEVTEKAARESGLRAGTPVVAGGLDAACGALGAGVIAAGDIHEQSGSAGGMSLCLDRFTPARGMIFSRHVVPGQYLLQGGTVGGGGLIRWLEEDVLYPDGAREDSRARVEEMMAAAAVSSPGAGGCVFLPYLAGERSPLWNPRAKGVFFGLDYGKNRGDLVRAVMEGAAFALRHNLEAAGDAVASGSVMRAVGGAAENGLWMQIKADVTGHPICPVANGDATAVGCAMLAGVGCGALKSFEEAVGRYVSLGPAFQPQEENRPVYDALYGRYRAVYDGLKHLMA